MLFLFVKDGIMYNNIVAEMFDLEIRTHSHTNISPDPKQNLSVTNDCTIHIELGFQNATFRPC